MTWAAENRHWLEPYIRDLATRLGLGHWTITLRDTMPEGYETKRATNWLPNDYNEMMISFADQIEMPYFPPEPWTPEMVRVTAIHELLHASFRNLGLVVESTYEVLSSASRGFVSERWDHELECLIEAQAVLLARFMPLPVIPEEMQEAA